jgi:hypothetical protein
MAVAVTLSPGTVAVFDLGAHSAGLIHSQVGRFVNCKAFSAGLERITRLGSPSVWLASAASTWSVPRDIDWVEWFVSPTDICHVYAPLATLSAASNSRTPSTSPSADASKNRSASSSRAPAGLEPGTGVASSCATRLRRAGRREGLPES